MINQNGLSVNVRWLIMKICWLWNPYFLFAFNNNQLQAYMSTKTRTKYVASIFTPFNVYFGHNLGCLCQIMESLPHSVMDSISCSATWLWCLFYDINYMLFFYFSSASNRIIAAKDHASIQVNFADVSCYCVKLCLFDFSLHATIFPLTASKWNKQRLNYLNLK